MNKPLRIITADERFAEKSGAKLALLGKSGIGKTFTSTMRRNKVIRHC